MMAEVKEISDNFKFTEIFLVADSMSGQDAVNTAKNFSEKIDLTGIMLTRVDGDGRGGAALSMREVTKKPIKFIGVGEKIGDIEIFHPDELQVEYLVWEMSFPLLKKLLNKLTKKTQKNFKKNF